MTRTGAKCAKRYDIATTPLKRLTAAYLELLASVNPEHLHTLLGGYVLAGINDRRRDERVLQREIALLHADHSAQL